MNKLTFIDFFQCDTKNVHDTIFYVENTICTHKFMDLGIRFVYFRKQLCVFPKRIKQTKRIQMIGSRSNNLLMLMLSRTGQPFGKKRCFFWVNVWEHTILIMNPNADFRAPTLMKNLVVLFEKCVHRRRAGGILRSRLFLHFFRAHIITTRRYKHGRYIKILGRVRINDKYP